MTPEVLSPASLPGGRAGPAPARASRGALLLDILAVFSADDDEVGQARTLLALARELAQAGRGAAALRACRLALPAAAEDAAIGGGILCLAAEVLARRGRLRGAVVLYGRAEVLFMSGPGGLGSERRRVLAGAASLAAAVLSAEGDAEGARARLRQHCDEAAARGDAARFAAALCALGDLDLRAGQAENALLCAQTAAQARAAARLPALDEPLLRGRALAALHRLPEAQEALLEALARLEQALGPAAGRVTPLERPLLCLWRARAAEELGFVRLDLGRVAEGRAALLRAAAGYRELNEDSEAARLHLAVAATCGVAGVAAVPGRLNRSEALRHALWAADLLRRVPAPPRDLVNGAAELVAALPPGRLTPQLHDAITALARRSPR